MTAEPGQRIVRSRLEQEAVLIPPRHVTETIEVLTSHESVRRFIPRGLDDGMLDAILIAARSAPTSSNLQAYSIVVVQDRAHKERLAQLAGEQQFIAEAACFLLFCADIGRLRYISQRQGRRFGADTLEMLLLSSVDAALAMQNALVAAESLGLATTPIGAVRDFPRTIADELALPRGAYVVAGLCVGFEAPGARRGVKPRLPEQVTVHHERYDTGGLEDGIRAYDETMIRRGTYAGRQLSAGSGPEHAGRQYGWAEHTSLRCSEPGPDAPALLGRPQLRRDLEECGIFFD